MGNTLGIIDFKELVSPVPGEGLEQLVRHIGRKKGLSPVWSGRGADRGRDLFFTEELHGTLSVRKVKWLVSCKDKAKSNESISEKDFPASGIKDKLAQHKADGFLLVTTTTVSTGAKELLDSLDVSNGGDVHTLVWDSADLTSILLDPEYHDLLEQFLPRSYERVKGLNSLEGAILTFRDQLPDVVLKHMLRLVEPYSSEPLKGSAVWPHDTDSASAIDNIVVNLLIRKDACKAVAATEGIEYDAFVSLCEKLYDKYSDECYNYLAEIICKHQDFDLKFNAAQFLLDNYEVSPADKIAFSSCLDEDALSELYVSEISNFIREELVMHSSNYALHDQLDILSSATVLIGIDITRLNIHPQAKRIRFSGEMDVDTTLQYGNELARNFACPGRFEGYFDEHGIYLTSAEVDTSAFYE